MEIPQGDQPEISASLVHFKPPGPSGDASAPAELRPSDLCYAIFTSGSTGAGNPEIPGNFPLNILKLNPIECKNLLSEVCETESIGHFCLFSFK